VGSNNNNGEGAILVAGKKKETMPPLPREKGSRKDN